MRHPVECKLTDGNVQATFGDDGVELMCSILGTPIPQGRLRHARFGRGYYPKGTVTWSKRLDAYFMEASLVTMLKPLVEARIKIWITGARANSDLDNHAKIILDALVRNRVIKSDDIRCVRALSLVAGPVMGCIPKALRSTLIRIRGHARTEDKT